MRYLLFILCLSAPVWAWSNDLLRNGAGANTAAVGGVTAMAGDPLAAMTGNPALLSRLHSRTLQIGVTAVSPDATYENRFGTRASADGGPGILPDIAVAGPVNNTRWTVGAAVNMQSALKADYRFADPPGTLGVNYGIQRHMSEYIALRTALGASYRLTDSLSVGGTVGATYNRNRLQVPYVFQRNPSLAGLKVLADLKADDLGVNASLGLEYRISDHVRLGGRYSFETGLIASGRLAGNLSGLGLPLPDEFVYDAEVETAVPASLALSTVWRVSPVLKLGLELEWVNWSDAFDQLNIRLRNGDNTALNNFIGSDSIDDAVPLAWRDQYIVHVGVEYAWRDDISLRAGYQYGRSPVPSGTLTPLTAAITEHALSLGAGYGARDYLWDVAYRWSLPHTVQTGDSDLLGGEYNGSSVRTSVHWLSISLQF